MKKYNNLIMLSVALWLVLATIAGFGIQRLDIQKNNAYKVEINRLYNRLSGEMEPDKLVVSENTMLKSCQYVKDVAWLSATELTSEESTERFYEADNRYEMEVKPVYKEGRLEGFVRFDYEMSGLNTTAVMKWLQLGLFVMELLVLFILIYLKYHLIRPFEQLQRLPYELAQGHLKGIVKEEKSRFFGQFMWGLGQLKDKLEVTKKRNLELEKEKKLLLVSLSHDIKTPLNNIRLYAKALEENLYESKEEQKYAACRIGEKTVEIEHYVEEIMQHAREDILDIQVNNDEFYLETLIQKVLTDYSEKCAIRMIELQVASYENRLIKGDLDRSVEVFENIFENAFKYGDGKKITIDFMEEEDCQLIRIYNTGETVSENDFNHIFESFFRAANSEGKPGCGLGLYICREIMTKMGGSIYAEREEDGMSFVLVFE